MSKVQLNTSLSSTVESFGGDRFVASGIIHSSGKVLLLRRLSSDAELPGLWELPGGHVEPGEAVVESLRREIFEETGIRAEQEPHFVSYFDYTTTSGAVTRQLNFVISLAGQRPALVLSEHDAHAWVKVSDLSRFSCSPETAQSIGFAHQQFG